LVCRTFTLVEGCKMNHTKGDGLAAEHNQPAKTHTNDLSSATGKPHSKPIVSSNGRTKRRASKFAGTSNPRHLRVIAALLRHPMLRVSLDDEAGCSNGPDLVAELRRRGLDVPCQRINFLDCDGVICRPGVYMLTPADHRKLNRWLTKRRTRGANS
jgi:hypothetical protein